MHSAAFHHDRFDAADLDRPAGAPPRRRLVILSTARSGSYLLCRQLWRAGLGVPTEYLRARTIRTLSARWSLPAGDDAAYLDAVERHRTAANGVFAAKLQPLHVQAHPLARERWIARADLVVTLERRDRLAQAASWQVSLATGYWSSDATPGPRAPGVPLGDPAYARGLAAQLGREHRWIDATCAELGRATLALAYEALVEDQPGAVAAIAARLGLDAGDYRLPATEARGAGAPAAVERARADLLAALRAGR